MPRPALKPVLALASLLAFGPVLSACGEDGGTASGRADVPGARQQIARYRGLPRFVAPGPAFDAVARVRGKTIFEIPITSEIPFVASVEKGMRQATDLVGAKLTIYRNQGQPTQWAQGISTAIAQHADAITLLAQDPELVRPQIAKAEKAGIRVDRPAHHRRRGAMPGARRKGARDNVRARALRAGGTAGG